jgi:hypothetical protein
MQSLLAFKSTIFWILFFFFFLNANNLLSLMLYSEIIWVILYIISIYLGILNDDINLLSTSFFLLALAGLEFSFGLLIVILFKNNKINYDFNLTNTDSNQFFKKNLKNLYIKRYIWNI